MHEFSSIKPLPISGNWHLEGVPRIFVSFYAAIKHLHLALEHREEFDISCTTKSLFMGRRRTC